MGWRQQKARGKAGACPFPSATGQSSLPRAASAHGDDVALRQRSIVRGRRWPPLRSRRSTQPGEPVRSALSGLRVAPSGGRRWCSPPPSPGERLFLPPRSPAPDYGGKTLESEREVAATSASPLVPALEGLGRKRGSAEPGSGQAGSMPKGSGADGGEESGSDSLLG